MLRLCEICGSLDQADVEGDALKSFELAGRAQETLDQMDREAGDFDFEGLENHREELRASLEKEIVTKKRLEAEVE
jgi:hypothetical protein